jgi:hypothetical protein
MLFKKFKGQPCAGEAEFKGQTLKVNVLKSHEIICNFCENSDSITTETAQYSFREFLLVIPTLLSP